MNVVCAPRGHPLLAMSGPDLRVVLFGNDPDPNVGSVGGMIPAAIQRQRLSPDSRSWDLLALALSVIAADTGVRRDLSPDGWTREIELEVTVSDPDFWNGQRELIERQLRFLTTDIWRLQFHRASFVRPASTVTHSEDCALLLSGGLDSLIGALDLASAGKKPVAVSQVAQGDKRTQSIFAARVGGGMPHLQLNHNAAMPGQHERSQRARSFAFFAYGVLACTSLTRYLQGGRATLFVCENGFISLNPPLTAARLGSLSTRTTHPIYLKMFQSLLDNAGLRVDLVNPYQLVTKGEMLAQCTNQALLANYGAVSTSCGRFARNGYTHCGRCLPCLIRRASFSAANMQDATPYVFANLALRDSDHSGYDDVRSTGIAIAEARSEGFDVWARRSVEVGASDQRQDLLAVAQRGLDELATFLSKAGVA